MGKVKNAMVDENEVGGAPTDTEPTKDIETKQYPDGTTATGMAPLPDVSPTLPAAYTDTNALLLELVAHTESLEPSVAERIRETVAKLRVSLGL